MDFSNECQARSLLDQVEAELQHLELRMRHGDTASAPLVDAAASLLAKLTRDHPAPSPDEARRNESWRLMLMAEAAALCDRAEILMRDAQRTLLAGRPVRRRPRVR